MGWFDESVLTSLARKIMNDASEKRFEYAKKFIATLDGKILKENETYIYSLIPIGKSEYCMFISFTTKEIELKEIHKFYEYCQLMNIKKTILFSLKKLNSDCLEEIAKNQLIETNQLILADIIDISAKDAGNFLKNFIKDKFFKNIAKLFLPRNI